MQLSIDNFLKPVKNGGDEAKKVAIKDCECLGLVLNKMQLYCKDKTNECKNDNSNECKNKNSKHSGIANAIKGMLACKYQWLEAYGDTLSTRTKFITKVNKCTLHKFTVAQLFISSSVLEAVSKIEDFVTCMHMHAGVIVCDSERHALYFDVNCVNLSKCLLQIHDTVHDTIQNTIQSTTYNTIHTIHDAICDNTNSIHISADSTHPTHSDELHTSSVSYILMIRSNY